MAVRKSTGDGLKNMANDDVIRQAHLKQEMMSNEQMGPTQMYAPPSQHQTLVVVIMGMR